MKFYYAILYRSSDSRTNSVTSTKTVRHSKYIRMKSVIIPSQFI